MVTLYHPDLGTSIEVADKSVAIHEKSGWTRDEPKKQVEPKPVERKKEEISG